MQRGNLGLRGEVTVIALQGQWVREAEYSCNTFSFALLQKIAHVPYFCSNSYLNAVSAFAMTAPVSGTAGTVAEDHFKIPV